jgi:hypothetical protein
MHFYCITIPKRAALLSRHRNILDQKMSIHSYTKRFHSALTSRFWSSKGALRQEWGLVRYYQVVSEDSKSVSREVQSSDTVGRPKEGDDGIANSKVDREEDGGSQSRSSPTALASNDLLLVALLQQPFFFLPCLIHQLIIWSALV